MKGRLLVIDDNKGIRDFLSMVLEKEGYEVFISPDGRKGVEMFAREGADAVITDLHMPEMDGIQTLKEIIKINPEAVVVIMTVDASVKKAVEAIKLGAYDYIIKDGDGVINAEELKIAVEKGVENSRMKFESAYFREELKRRSDFSSIVGSCAAMKNVFETVKKVADIDSTVLICGESGTGKELIAQAIHYSGKRAAHPFVTINCSAMPEPLFESELFGHEKGSFTGAGETKKGLFEVGERGTVFLDEIGEMPLTIQSKVLRILDDKEFRRVGGTKNIKVDARVVAATNRDLHGMAKNGSFREDLYYRLNVIPVNLPPLREKKDDIPLLARHFVEKYNNLLHKKIKGVSGPAMQALAGYSWPGNARELENMIERAITLIADGREEIGIKDLPSQLLAGPGGSNAAAPAGMEALPGDTCVDFKALVGDYEKRLLSEALSRVKKKKEAAKNLKLNPRMLRYLVKKYRLGNED